jgi:hypothetical protein
MPESSLQRIILRCLLPSSDRSRQDFEFLVILAAKAALSLLQLQVMELWGTCLDRQEGQAYMFRYSCKDGRASILWRSCEETTVAQVRIMAKWNQVAEKHTHLTLADNVVPFTETKAEISKSNGTSIFRHLLLKGLVFDPITQIILENEHNQWGSNQKSDSSEPGDALDLNIVNPNLLDGDLLMDILEQDADFESLEEDLMAFDAQVNALVQRHQG